ncbi:MAG: capsular polysaccharide transport system permease protein [Yoonia sp.]|jgi:capsular polysaccharide transport system permease protein
MRIHLPDTTDSTFKLPAQKSESASERNASEIRQIQRDIARRRQRKVVLLFTRLIIFIFLPTIMVWWYFYNLATPMYATNSEIVIQQAQPQGGGGAGLATMFQGTSMATQQDNIAVRSYLASREAMLRLDADHGFKGHFSDPSIDALQRLPVGATNEDAFGVFSGHDRISYDPTEGIIRMEVIPPDPQKCYEFSLALLVMPKNTSTN